MIPCYFRCVAYFLKYFKTYHIDPTQIISRAWNWRRNTWFRLDFSQMFTFIYWTTKISIHSEFTLEATLSIFGEFAPDLLRIPNLELFCITDILDDGFFLMLTFGTKFLPNFDIALTLLFSPGWLLKSTKNSKNSSSLFSYKGSKNLKMMEYFAYFSSTFYFKPDFSLKLRPNIIFIIFKNSKNYGFWFLSCYLFSL